ncbi:MAG: zinc-ribbon domain-containing protein [Pirellula sp.]|jgi:hypothetical protein|nr:zinc-ribbon domain-containing protein [Pirellula sp.]
MTRRRDKKRFQGRNGIPTGAVAADTSKQVPNNSYDPPPNWYIDKPFTCCECGREDVWTAQQQKWYYEVAKGSLFATATHCRECRNRIRDARDEQRKKSEAGRSKAND